MYFTDRGIEELVERRGEETVNIVWLAERLREFVDLNPDVRDPGGAAGHLAGPARRRKTSSRDGGPGRQTPAGDPDQQSRPRLGADAVH